MLLSDSKPWDPKQNHFISFRSELPIIPATLILKSYFKIAVLYRIKANHRSLNKQKNTVKDYFYYFCCC